MVIMSVLATVHLLSDQSVAVPLDPPCNVVIVFTDDQGWGDLGCQGSAEIPTPNIDRLAAEGIRFTDFYVSQPVCSASRASLLTGCYANRIGIAGALGPSSRVGLDAGEVTIAEVLRPRGYATACLGKWHLGHHPAFLPVRHGFDLFSGLPYSNDMWPLHPESPDAWPPLSWYRIESGARDPVLEPIDDLADQDLVTRRITREAVEFIRDHAERPFFLLIAHPMPHVPLGTGPEFRQRTRYGPYGDVIRELDWSVGAVRAALAEVGVLDRTLIIFTSDNGPWLSYGDHAGSTGGLREGKGTTFEGGVRVPMVARLPGVIPPGTVTAEPCMTIDLLPTIAELTGSEAHLGSRMIDGRSLLPLLRDEPGAASPHEALFFWYGDGALEAMRSGRWKLHFPHAYRSMEGRAPGNNGIPGRYDYGRRIGLELFDLEADPGETTDLASVHPEVVARLSALAEAARAELGDGARDRPGTGCRQPGRVEP